MRINDSLAGYWILTLLSGQQTPSLLPVHAEKKLVIDCQFDWSSSASFPSKNMSLALPVVQGLDNHSFANTTTSSEIDLLFSVAKNVAQPFAKMLHALSAQRRMLQLF